MTHHFLHNIAKKISNSLAFGLGIVLTLSIAYAATTWVSGQAPQTAPVDGNIATPVFVDGPMLAGLGCVTTGNGNGIKCDAALKAAADLVIAADAFDYNIATELGNPTESIDVTLTINTGIIVGSTSTGNAALSTGSLPAGSTVKIVNKGRIQGKGGDGGAGYNACQPAGAPGGTGGNGLELLLSVTLDNASGEIWAGGGGGGGGGNGCGCPWSAGNGGGGGAGSVFGSGGSGTYFNGTNGTTLLGGVGGTSSAPHIQIVGGNGGVPGTAGTNGSNGCSAGGGAGGLAGDAVQGNGNVITWIGAQGDIKGQIN